MYVGGLSHANEKKKVIYDEWMSWAIVKAPLINMFVVILREVMHVIDYIEKLNADVLKELESWDR